MWHHLDHMRVIFTSLQTDSHVSTSSLIFDRPDALPDVQPTASKHWRQCLVYSLLVKSVYVHFYICMDVCIYAGKYVGSWNLTSVVNMPRFVIVWVHFHIRYHGRWPNLGLGILYLFLGDCLWSGSPYAIGPWSCLSVCDIGILWQNSWMDQDETWHADSPRPRPHCVRWRPSSPQKGHSPQFSAHVCCGHTARWIKNQDATWYGSRPRPRPHCVRWGPSPTPPPKKGGMAKPHPKFPPMSIVTKRLDGSRCHFIRR